ncbi:MAG: ribosome biogenesis GTPase Der [bacterium]|nr:ribosome biogenesis GTPase Der [bacterium]
MLPIVSIVGRENVGKSTLFNRLIGSRIAVTHPQPGITRDRNIKEVDLFGAHIYLVDTGGYFPYEHTGLKAKVKEQVEVSLESSSLILFIVDAKTGLVPVDLEICDRLRKLGKKLILVVNKVDNLKRESGIVEFYKLGFAKLVPVSATHGIGINTLIDKIKEEIEVREVEKEDKIPRLAILGRPNVGKSTYINALLQEPRVIVDEHPGTTIDSIDVTLKYDGRELILIDTPGIRKRTKIRSDIEYYSSVRTKLTIQKCDVAILIVDATIRLAHQDKKIIDILIKEGKGIVLAINKIDVGVEFREWDLRFATFIPITYISALKQDRVYEPIKEAVKVWEVRRHKISRRKLTELIKSLPGLGINAIVQTGIEPPRFKIMSRNPITKTDERFIENKLREKFGFTGVPIKITHGLHK